MLFSPAGCSANCTVESGWQCSGATDREADTCSVLCGDGRQLDSGCCADTEECSQECSPLWGCDDGNTKDGDGCSKTCSIESGFDCWRGDVDNYSPCLCTRTRVSASTEHSCAIDANAKLECWGDPANNKTVTYFDAYDGAYAWPRGSWVPQNVFTQVSTGANHNCATKFTGEAICWGWLGPGANGDGRLYMPPAPDWERNAGGGLLWEQLSLGFAHSCGMLNEKRFRYRPVCGEGQEAGPGCPNREECAQQCREDGDWALHWLERHPCFLSYVDQYTCTVPSNKTVVCWGADNYKQIQMPVSSTWRELDSGWYHSCGVTDDGTAHCWGNDNYGQATVPPHSRKWAQVAAGGSHSCGLDQDRYITCWGRSHELQTQVPFPNSWLRVSAGWLHTCAIHSDFSLECWGANDSGQCDVPIQSGKCKGGKNDGQGCTTNRACTGGGVCSGPRKRDWTQVTCGRLHTCAVDKSDRVFCWGSNQYGQAALPKGTTVQVGIGRHGEAACRDSASFTDALGFKCIDWIGATDCYENAKYSEEGLAAVRKACPQACKMCGGDKGQPIVDSRGYFTSPCL
jgi:hypothetical protein|eukprot:Tamp_05118.p1 GENE.Tamp_05118~~Tamp_05118.p1  ORF type:complete len:570 (+),score=107.79 Tamp_05118:564-2273(+)